MGVSFSQIQVEWQHSILLSQLSNLSMRHEWVKWWV